MKQLEMLYEGKAKQVFLTDDPEMIVIHYKDSLPGKILPVIRKLSIFYALLPYI